MTIAIRPCNDRSQEKRREKTEKKEEEEGMMKRSWFFKSTDGSYETRDGKFPAVKKRLEFRQKPKK